MTFCMHTRKKILNYSYQRKTQHYYKAYNRVKRMMIFARTPSGLTACSGRKLFSILAMKELVMYYCLFSVNVVIVVLYYITLQHIPIEAGRLKLWAQKE